MDATNKLNMLPDEFYPKVADFKKSELRRRVLAGETPEDITKFFNVTVHVYNNYMRLARTGAGNFGDLNREYAVRRGYNGLSEYQMDCALERASRPRNMAFANLMRKALRRKGMKQKDLSKETRISPTQISKYCLGSDIPRPQKQKILLSALGLPYKTIDEALRESENLF